MTDAEAVVASRFAEADLAAGRFINVLDGEKGTRDHDTRYSDPRDAPGTNYGIYPGEGLVYLDVDDYGEAVDDAGLAAVRDLPETLRTESPHTDGEPGGHRFYHVTGEAVDALKEAFGTANPQPSWGEVRADNQYVVGPGSRLDGCSKEWCDACATPDGGRYTIATDAPIATISAKTLVDALREDPDLSKPADGDGVDTQTSGSNPTPGADTSRSSDDAPDLEDKEVLDKAKNAENADKFRKLWRGDTSDYDSHSEADLALVSLLSFYTGDDRKQIDRLFCRSDLFRDKWDRDDYRRRTISEALRGDPEFYDPDAGDTDGDGDDTPPVEGVESDLIDALLDEPSAWIDADAKTWTVRNTDDHDADEIADALADGDLPGDAWDAFASAVIDGDIPDQIGDAVSSWRDDPDAWAVDMARDFDGSQLSPDAVASDIGVPMSDLGEERNGRIAYHVWERTRDGDHARVIARTGVDGDDELLSYDADTGVWREDGAEELRTLARSALGDVYGGGVKNELVEQVLATRCDGEPWGQKPIRRLGADPNTVPVANGTVDLADRTLRPRQATEYVLAALPVEYDPDAECPIFTEYLKEVCPRSVDRKKLQEYVGYTLMHWDLPYHKALFLAGPQASGKSTFLDTVNALLGGDPDADRGTTCSLSPQEMTEEKFAGYGLRKAWANIRSDIPNDLIENTGKFKELVAGDPVKVEKKYQDPITIRPTTKHLFAANTLPTADVDDDAFFRRILLVSFPNTVPRRDRDPNLAEKIETELSGILNWALDGLDRLREQGYFTGSPTPADIQAKWRAWSNSVDRFKQRILETTNDPDDAVPKSDMLDAYHRFCDAEGIPAKGNQKFYKKMKNDSNIGEERRRVDGSRKRMYTRVRVLGGRIADAEDADTDTTDAGQARFS
jgi:putative DNA primase/helicase